MPWLFILVAIVWVVIGAAGNKKKQQARAEAEKQAAAQRQQPASAAPPQPRPAAPFSPYFPDAQRPAPQPARPASQPQRPAPTQAMSQPRMQQVPASRMQQGMQEGPASRMQTGPASTLTELKQTQRHTLVPSDRSGHAHQETSMTGFEPDCPPETRAAAVSAASRAYAGMPAFSWNPNAVLNGMVYAEILSKPKALRG